MAGLWSSLSGAGRFVSRAGTGFLVDHVGFQMTAVVVFGVQALVIVATLGFFAPKCRRRPRPSDAPAAADAGTAEAAVDAAAAADEESTKTASFSYSVVDAAGYPRLTISQPESPADSLTCRSVTIPLPRHVPDRRSRAETYAGSRP